VCFILGSVACSKCFLVCYRTVLQIFITFTIEILSNTIVQFVGVVIVVCRYEAVDSSLNRVFGSLTDDFSQFFSVFAGRFQNSILQESTTPHDLQSIFRNSSVVG
jgi:hypothetical protein